MRYAGNFTATTQSRPLGEGGLPRSGKTEGVIRSAALSKKAALQMPFSVMTPPVKMRLERSAERDKREIINNLSAEYAQSNAERI